MGHLTWLIFENGVTDHNIKSLVTFHVPTIDLAIVFDVNKESFFSLLISFIKHCFPLGFLHKEVGEPRCFEALLLREKFTSSQVLFLLQENGIANLR